MVKSVTRLLWTGGTAAFLLAMLQTCGEPEPAGPAFFVDNEAATQFDVAFGNSAGNIDSIGFGKLLSSDLVVETHYLPTTLFWPVTADFEVRWGSYLPFPSLHVVPREKTVRLHAGDYEIIDTGNRRFKAKRNLSLSYALSGARVEIAALAPILNWPDEPLILNIRLAQTPDVSRPGMGGRSVKVKEFVFDSIRYAVTGSVKASNARALLDSQTNLSTDVTTLDTRWALAGSRYSGYLKALSTARLRDEYLSRVILDAYLLERDRRNPPVCDRSDAPGCCCRIGPAQAEEKMEKYRTLLDRYRNARDWGPVWLLHTEVPPPSPAESVIQQVQIHAKAEGHLLDLLTSEFHPKEIPSDATCRPSKGSRLFFVDRQLVDYQSTASECPQDGNANETLTRAKWDDLGQRVYFHREATKPKSVENAADEVTWASMMSYGKYTAECVLQSPDVSADAVKRR